MYQPPKNSILMNSFVKFNFSAFCRVYVHLFVKLILTCLWIFLAGFLLACGLWLFLWMAYDSGLSM